LSESVDVLRFQVQLKRKITFLSRSLSRYSFQLPYSITAFLEFFPFPASSTQRTRTPKIL
jgi:hypothetical protein